MSSWYLYGTQFCFSEALSVYVELLHNFFEEKENAIKMQIGLSKGLSNLERQCQRYLIPLTFLEGEVSGCKVPAHSRNQRD